MVSTRNVSIVGKFAIILYVIGLIAVVWIAYCATAMQQINEAYTSVSNSQGRAADALAGASQFLSEMRAAIGELEIATTHDGNDKALAELREARRQYSILLAEAKAADPMQAPALDRLAQDVQVTLDTSCALAIKLGFESTEDVKAAQVEYLKSCGPAFPRLINDLTSLARRARGNFKAFILRLAAETNRTISITYYGLFGCLFLILPGAYFAIKAWISRPIINLAQIMVRLAEGDILVPVIGADRRDEIGPMARAVQIFKDNGAKLRAADELRLVHQQEQHGVVSALALGLASLSRGDLTHRLDQRFGASYEQLRTDFNATADSLHHALKTIAIATDGINVGSSEIAQASHNLAQRTERQAANLEETASALNHITQTVHKMAAGAGAAADVAAATRGAVEASGLVVEQAIDAMGKIKDSSLRICQIVGLIDDVAARTNLLSLNAAIEAAGAGEAGRGFAVVAAEVRSLAGKSAEAAKEIKALIRLSTGHVESGVGLVGRTGVALKEIIERVATMDRLVQDISESSQEQALGLAEVNTAVGQMEQVVQQNAAMVEESTAAAHALKGESQHLTTIVGRFRLDEDEGLRHAVAGEGWYRRAS